MLQGNMSADVQGILDHSVELGYEIAIASASCSTDFLRKYLQNRVSPDVFTDEFLNSPAFQTCQWCASLSYSRLPLENEPKKSRISTWMAAALSAANFSDYVT